MNQYSLGDEPGRKELLDALLNYLEREGRREREERREGLSADAYFNL